MKLNTPLVTLLSGAALGVGVLVASILQPSSTASASGYGATSSAPATTAAPPPASSAPAPPPTTAPAPSPSAVSGTSSAGQPASAPASPPQTTPAAAPTVTAAPPPAYVPPMANYVGQVNGGGAAVAISVHDGKAVAYVCNGHAVAAWYRGTAAGGKLDLTGKNGARLSVDYRTGQASGSVMADGVHYTFSASVVHGASGGRRPPGLYEATAAVDGVTIKAGWIVLPDGSQVGSVEYELGSAILPTAQAPVLDLATGTARYDGVTLVASLISGLTGSGF
jgi:hypothetical protein